MKKTLRNLMLAGATLLMAGNAYAATAVTPATGGTANPFAYALSSTSEEGVVTINYSLNADATAVAINLIGGEGTVVKTVDLEGDFLTKGAHTTTVELAGLSDGCYNWEVKVTGAAKAAMEEFAALRFYHPRGVDVDNNMENPTFGNIYVTEGMSTEKGIYHSNTTTSGGLGLYAFTADMDSIINPATGKYGFNGGLTLDYYVVNSTGGNTSGADLCRVRVDKTGKIYVTRQNDNGDYLFAADANTLLNENKLEPIFTGGAVDATTYAYTLADGTFISAPNQGFDIKGEGENLKLILLSGQKKIFPTTYTPGATRVDEYSLGTAQTWSSAPTAISALSGKYTASYSSVNVTYDNRGGIWYSQYRTSTTISEASPALVYIDANGNEIYKDASTVRGGGGFRFNSDFTQVAIASSLTTFSIYDITYAEDNTPTLTEIYTITHGIGRNVNDIAWDLAGNIYICGNSGEYLKGFSIPRENNDFTTKAAAQYTIYYTAPVEPTADPLYITGENVGGNWDPANAAEFEFDGENYVITVDENTTQFKISTQKGDWDTFNSGNLAIDAAITNGGIVNLSVNKDGGNIVLPWAGVWTITVAADLSTLTATTETPEPAPSYEPLYMVGYNNGWDPANPLEIPYDATKGAYYIAGVEFTNTKCKISRTKGTWDDFNSNGICSSNDATIIIGTPCSLYLQYCGNIPVERTGTFNITIDMVNATILLEEVINYPDALFLCGNLKDANWDPAYDGAILDSTEEGVYAIENVALVAVDGNDNAYFSFNTTTGSWDDVNSSARYGATSADEAVTLGENMTVVNGGTNTNAWMVEPGTYNFIVDLVNMTMVVTKSTTGVESIDADNNAPAVYYNLQGVEVANPENGVYIMKQGNKVTKVVK